MLVNKSHSSLEEWPNFGHLQSTGYQGSSHTVILIQVIVVGEVSRHLSHLSREDSSFSVRDIFAIDAGIILSISL